MIIITDMRNMDSCNNKNDEIALFPFLTKHKSLALKVVFITFYLFEIFFFIKGVARLEENGHHYDFDHWCCR